MNNKQITIHRAYIKLFKGNYIHAAVLTEIEKIAVTYPCMVRFPCPHDELADKLFLTADQVRYSVKLIKKQLNGVVQTEVKKFNGIPTVHYLVNTLSLAQLKNQGE
jgi:hypothetical protein